MKAASIATLSEQNWPFFNDFAAPIVLSAGKYSDVALNWALLARLAEDGHLNELGVCSKPIEEHTATLLTAWIAAWKKGKVTERQVRNPVACEILTEIRHSQTSEMLDCLNLASRLPKNAPLAQNIFATIKYLTRHTTSSDAKQDFKRTALNSAAILAACLRAFSALRAEQMLDQEDILLILEKYGWHRLVMKVLGQAACTDQILPNLEDMHRILEVGIVSEDTEIRSSSLRMLLAAAPGLKVLKQCLDIENVPMTIQDAREKTSQLRRLGNMLRGIQEETIELRIGLSYCIAMLKVNFKPLWNEAIDAITGTLQGRKGNTAQNIWDMIAAELQKVSTSNNELFLIDAPDWAQATEAEDLDNVKDPLQEGQFICTSHARIVATYTSCADFFSGHFQALIATASIVCSV